MTPFGERLPLTWLAARRHRYVVSVAGVTIASATTLEAACAYLFLATLERSYALGTFDGILARPCVVDAATGQSFAA